MNLREENIAKNKIYYICAFFNILMNLIYFKFLKKFSKIINWIVGELNLFKFDSKYILVNLIYL